jgi:hypothetical protein
MELDIANHQPRFTWVLTSHFCHFSLGKRVKPSQGQSRSVKASKALFEKNIYFIAVTIAYESTNPKIHSSVSVFGRLWSATVA